MMKSCQRKIEIGQKHFFLGAQPVVWHLYYIVMSLLHYSPEVPKSSVWLMLECSWMRGGHTLRKMYQGVVTLQGVAKNLSPSCTNQLNPTSCFFPQNIVPHIQTPMFILNAAYDSWQVVSSLSPASADPNGAWKACRNNPGNCSSQMSFFQGIRNQMLNALKGFSTSKKNGLFVNSCFAHCQTEGQDTWFADDSPVINKKGAKRMYNLGLLTFIDCVDVDEFCTKFLDKALEELGYWAPERWFCYFKKHDQGLDTGLQLITDDVEQLKQITDYAKIHKEIEVYVTRNDFSHFSNSDQTMPVPISKIITGSSSARRLFD